MTLSPTELHKLDKILTPLIEDHSQSQNKPQLLKALQLALKEKSLTERESVALSIWKHNNISLLPTILSVRELLHDSLGMSGIDNKKSIVNYVNHKIKSKIESLKNKEKIKAQSIPEVTAASLAAFTSFMSQYFINATQATKEAAKIVLKNNILRPAITQTLLGGYKGFIKGNGVLNLEALAGSIGGVIEGTITDTVPPEYRVFTKYFIKGATSGLQKNIKKDIYDIAEMMSLKGATKASAAAIGIHNMPFVYEAYEAVITNYILKEKDTNTFSKTIEKSVQKAARKMFSGNGVINLVESQVISFGLSKMSKSLLRNINTESILNSIQHKSPYSPHLGITDLQEIRAETEKTLKAMKLNYNVTPTEYGLQIPLTMLRSINLTDKIIPTTNSAPKIKSNAHLTTTTPQLVSPDLTAVSFTSLAIVNKTLRRIFTSTSQSTKKKIPNSKSTLTR